MYQKNLQRYQSTRVLTAEPEKIVLMLFNGLQSYLEQATHAALLRDHPKRAAMLERSNNILLELLSSLNYESGGEIACNLREIYVFVLGSLKKANINNDAELIQECRAVVGDLRDGWIGIANRNKSNGTHPQQAKKYSYA